MSEDPTANAGADDPEKPERGAETDSVADGEPDPSTDTTGDESDEAADVAANGETAEDGASNEASADAPAGEDEASAGDDEASAGDAATEEIPEDVQQYARFTKMDHADYERVNEFLRERTYITAREWAIARLCADFRTETGVEMTKIGQNLPRLVPFMTDTYTPQAVNQARASFEEKVTKAGATFLYGAMSGFFTAEELDETMYEVTEIAKFLLEVEGVDLSVEEELEAEDEISRVMRDVREASATVRGEEVKCPECGHVHEPE